MSRWFRLCMTKGGRGCLRPSYRRPKLALVSRCFTTRLRCNKKRYCRYSQNIAYTSNQRPLITYEETLINKGNDILKKMWWYIFLLHIFANESPLVALNQLRATKTRSKLPPAANFRLRGVCSPIGLFTFYGPSQCLFSFPSTGSKNKKIQFFTNFRVRPQKTFAAYCKLNFDATDLPHS